MDLGSGGRAVCICERGRDVVVCKLVRDEFIGINGEGGEQTKDSPSPSTNVN